MMKMKITSVEEFIEKGCGRCEKANTPECKVQAWQPEIKYLRKIALASGLNEDLKWSQPCYTYNEKNIVLVSALNNEAVISFINGSLLSDPEKILTKAGENSKIDRLIKFKDLDSIQSLEPVIRSYIDEAKQLIDAGKKVVKSCDPESIPAELQAAFDNDPALQEAFQNLTPGRARSHILHIRSAKQSQTRHNRVEKCAAKIFDGLGFNEYAK